jgi:hypothetical protein
MPRSWSTNRAPRCVKPFSWPAYKCLLLVCHCASLVISLFSRNFLFSLPFPETTPFLAPCDTISYETLKPGRNLPPNFNWGSEGYPPLFFVFPSQFPLHNSSFGDHLMKSSSDFRRPFHEIELLAYPSHTNASGWFYSGRPKDFSDSDAKFAKAVGLTFYTPEEFFKWNQLLQHIRPSRCSWSQALDTLWTSFLILWSKINVIVNVIASIKGLVLTSLGEACNITGCSVGLYFCYFALLV